MCSRLYCDSLCDASVMAIATSHVMVIVVVMMVVFVVVILIGSVSGASGNNTYFLQNTLFGASCTLFPKTINNVQK